MEDETCCCCVPIRYGVWTLAILGLIGAFGSSLESAVYFANGRVLEEVVGLSGVDAAKIQAIANGMYGAQLGFALVKFLLSALLIYGVWTKRAGTLRVWVQVHMLWLILSVVVGAVLLGALNAITKPKDEAQASVKRATMGLIYFGMALSALGQSYYTWVVHKYSKILKTDGNSSGGSSLPLSSVGPNCATSL